MMSKNINAKRILSIDVTRGLIVALSAFLSHIPPGGYPLFRHAEWYGLTILDFIFPTFLTVFGISMAVAYDRRIKWFKVVRRTILLLIFGLLFNMIVSWNFSLAEVRYTGVLQFYAVIGLITALVMKLDRRWWITLLMALVLLTGYGWFILSVSSSCPDGLPQPDCNPSRVIDQMLFGVHMYQGGERGYDPEGLVTLMGAIGNALIGVAIGRLLLANRKQGAVLPLLVFSLLLITCSLLVAQVLPYNKRMWLPSFTLVTAGTAALVLAIFHGLVDRLVIKGAVVRILEAFGRNSFFIYFGKYLLASAMIHTSISGESPRNLLLGFIESWSLYPHPTYAAVMFILWMIIAIIMHWRSWYIRV